MVRDRTRIGTAAAFDTVIADPRDHVRPEAALATALGQAMATGAGMRPRRAACWRLVLDVAGDGKSNGGMRPRGAKATGAVDGIAINALVVGSVDPAPGDPRRPETDALAAYFRVEVIQGADAFVERAAGFAGYADAMDRELLRELRVRVDGDAAPQ